MWNDETANILNIIAWPEFGAIITKYADNSQWKERVMTLTWQQFVILHNMMGEVISRNTPGETAGS